MKSFDVIRQAVDEPGVKAVAAALKVSPALVYKWCEPPADAHDPDQSGAKNPLDRVREIIPLPDHISELPRPETAVLGVCTLRDRLLPIVSLHALLGLQVASQRQQRSKVLVVSLGDGVVGVVADATREILRVEPNIIDPAPALLTRG